MTVEPTEPAPVGFSSVADALPEAVVVINGDGKILWGNKAAERMFAVTVDELTSSTGLDLVHPDDVELAIVALASVKSKTVGSLVELRLLAGGVWRLVELIGAPVDDKIVLAVRDLTGRRRWEVARDETARFRSIVQNSASLLLLINRDGTVAASSGALTRLLGHGQEWLEQRNLNEIVEDDAHEPLTRLLDDFAMADVHPPVSIDVKMRHASGQIVAFALTFVNLLADPTVEGIVVTGHDISERLLIEANLRHANSLLSATLESTTDGILVVNLAGRITSFNDTFIKMWAFPSSVLDSRDEDQALAFVMDQLADPDAFVAVVRDLNVRPDEQSHEILQFKDGRTVERFSMPQRIDEEIVGRVWSFRDVTANRRLEDELVHQAFHDPLTGLANRALFHDRVELATARAARLQAEVAVLFIDLDNFKTINDSLGHSSGDALLIAVSDRLQNSMRPGDSVARLGGDEFAALLDGLETPDTAAIIATRLVELMRTPFQIGGRTVSATVSIGMVFSKGGTSAEELLRSADLAMYTAKASGKNRMAIFDPKMHEVALKRLDTEAGLRGALTQDEFVLHYQPVVEMTSSAIHGFEALLRWDHPTRGLLPPSEFIATAEDGPMIDDISDHVLMTACAQVASWNTMDPSRDLNIAINISPQQLLDIGFPVRLDNILARAGLQPGSLTLEITERALMRETAATAQQLDRLRRRGIKISIDDFGTGYSSLSYLQQFPVDVLKIDRSFVTDIATQPRLNLAGAIIQIAHTLGVPAVAEGVETQAQASILGDLGCDFAQGFHFGRPLIAEDTASFLANTSRAGSMCDGDRRST